MARVDVLTRPGILLDGQKFFDRWRERFRDGQAFGGSIKVTEGSGLLSDNFPMIHATIKRYRDLMKRRASGDIAAAFVQASTTMTRSLAPVIVKPN